MQRRWNDTVGRLLLRLAVVLERTVAGDKASNRWLNRRNNALRSAYRRGVSVEVLAARLGLSAGWVRQVLAGKRAPEVEEAA